MAEPRRSAAVSPADVVVEFVGDIAEVSYQTEMTAGQGMLHKGHGTADSHLPARTLSWKRFRTLMFRQNSRGFIYRGQSDARKLRTSFHRTEKKTLHGYRLHALPQVYRWLSGQHDLRFNFADPDEFGAFVNLLQHHGYPTPLLDWTLSPFVAAYFAFANAGRDGESGAVRIYALDKAWISKPQISTFAFTAPHFSILGLLNIGNNRAIPQQAVSGSTNVDDIEAYIQMVETLDGRRYLQAYDIPMSDRKEALDDLFTMGIQAGAMMPGLDGSCRALRYAQFDV